MIVEDVLSKFNVAVSDEGNQTLMFAHGLGCDQKMWRFITPAFINNYKVVLFDIIGSGKSDSSAFDKDKYSGLQSYANDFIKIAEALKLKDVVLVSHSVSSMIALLAAISAPVLFKAIVMIGPSPCYINDKDYVGGFERKEVEGILDIMKANFNGWAEIFSTQVIGNENKKEFSDELKESFCSTDPDILHHFATITFLSDHRKDLSHLKIPTLIIQSSEDIIAPLEVGEYLHKNIEGSTLYITKETGHCPHLTAPGEVSRIIQQYLLDSKFAL